MTPKPDDDLVFALDAGLGNRVKVFVIGGPEDFRVSFSDPDREAWISVAKADWERIVARVQEQF
jgi:hypothetical protein